MVNLPNILQGIIYLYSLSFTSGITFRGEIITLKQKEILNQTAGYVLSELSTDTDNENSDTNEGVLSLSDTPEINTITPPPVSNENVVTEATNSASPTPVEAKVQSPAPTNMPIESMLTETPNPTSVQAVTLSDNSGLLLDHINSYRISMGYPPFATNSSVCDFAKLRALELTTNFDHEGFEERSQNGTLPYDNYSGISENIANTNTYSQVFELWKNSVGHNKNLLSDHTFACVGNVGNYYAFESLRP